MSTETESELRALEKLWREQPVDVPVPEEIRARVGRQERRLRLGALAEWLVAIVMCSVALFYALNQPTPSHLLLALVVFALVGWALNFSVANRRGLWCPLEESTEAYLDLAMLRLQRRRSGVRFAWLLYLVELLVFSVWAAFSALDLLEPLFSPESWEALWWLLGVTGALALWSLWVTLRAKREFAELEKLRAQSHNFM